MAAMTKLDQIMQHPNTPGWLLEATKQCLERDSLSAANEAELLAEAMRERVLSYMNSELEV